MTTLSKDDAEAIARSRNGTLPPSGGEVTKSAPVAGPVLEALGKIAVQYNKTDKMVDINNGDITFMKGGNKRGRVAALERQAQRRTEALDQEIKELTIKESIINQEGLATRIRDEHQSKMREQQARAAANEALAENRNIATKMAQEELKLLADITGEMNTAEGQGSFSALQTSLDLQRRASGSRSPNIRNAAQANVDSVVQRTLTLPNGQNMTVVQAAAALGGDDNSEARKQVIEYMYQGFYGTGRDASRKIAKDIAEGGPITTRIKDSTSWARNNMGSLAEQHDKYLGDRHAKELKQAEDNLQLASKRQEAVWNRIKDTYTSPAEAMQNKAYAAATKEVDEAYEVWDDKRNRNVFGLKTDQEEAPAPPANEFGLKRSIGSAQSRDISGETGVPMKDQRSLFEAVATSSVRIQGVEQDIQAERDKEEAQRQASLWDGFNNPFTARGRAGLAEDAGLFFQNIEDVFGGSFLDERKFGKARANAVTDLANGIRIAMAYNQFDDAGPDILPPSAENVELLNDWYEIRRKPRAAWSPADKFTVNAMGKQMALQATRDARSLSQDEWMSKWGGIINVPPEAMLDTGDKVLQARLDDVLENLPNIQPSKKQTAQTKITKVAPPAQQPTTGFVPGGGVVPAITNEEVQPYEGPIDSLNLSEFALTMDWKNRDHQDVLAQGLVDQLKTFTGNAPQTSKQKASNVPGGWSKEAKSKLEQELRKYDRNHLDGALRSLKRKSEYTPEENTLALILESLVYSPDADRQAPVRGTNNSQAEGDE